MRAARELRILRGPAGPISASDTRTRGDGVVSGMLHFAEHAESHHTLAWTTGFFM